MTAKKQESVSQLNTVLCVYRFSNHSMFDQFLVSFAKQLQNVFLLTFVSNGVSNVRTLGVWSEVSSDFELDDHISLSYHIFVEQYSGNRSKKLLTHSVIHLKLRLQLCCFIEQHTCWSS